MTQQQMAYGDPYNQPQQAQYGAPQGYAQAPAPYQPAPPQYAPQPNPYGQVPPQGYAPNPYGPQSGQPGYGQPAPQQGPPPMDLSGDLESFYAQRSVGGGKGISWKGVPDGYNVFGVVARPINNGDVFKETNPPQHPQAGQLKTNRDGSPKYAMQVPLKLLVPLQGYEDGEARLFLRGQLRDECTRAMAEVGAPEGPPEAGAFVRVTLTHRKPGNNIAQNMFAVIYRSPGTWENDPNILAMLNTPAPAPQYGAQPGYGAPQQAPYQQQAPAPYAAPAQAAPNPQQYAAPQYGQGAYDPNQGQAPAGVPYDFSQHMQQPDPNPQAQQGFQAAVPGPAQQYPQATPQGAEHAAPQGYAPQPAPAPNNQPVQQQLPLQVPQNGVQPSGLDPAKQALLARVTGGQQAGNPAQPQQ